MICNRQNLHKSAQKPTFCPLLKIFLATKFNVFTLKIYKKPKNPLFSSI
nr:MAG TPA: hypothetical protein [Caudoviricetes sp.]